MGKVKGSCKMVPDVPGTQEPSRMYQELNGLTKNRPLTNLVYASYLQPGIADAMDAAGYKRNKQGQHGAKSVYEFFEVQKMKGALGIKAQSRSEGFIDSTDTLIDFDANDAYTKAQAFNQNNKGRVAYVVQHGDKFNILIDEKDSRTQVRETEVNRALVLWGALTAELNSQGVDISALVDINPGLINPGEVTDFVKSLGNFKYTPNDGLSVKDIELLLAMNPSTPIVQNMLSRGWGNIAETAQKMYDVLHSSTASSTSITLVNNVLNEAKKLPKLNIQELRNNLNAATSSFEASDESANIQKTLADLDKKYHLENSVFVRKSSTIERFSEAAADAIMSLERQIRNIETKSGSTKQSESLRALKERLSEELKTRKNESGLLDFMNGAVQYVKQVNSILNNVQNVGTGLEYAHNLAEATSKATNLRDAYYNVIKAIADSDLVNDFCVTDTDKAELKELASGLKQLFDSQNGKIEELQKEAMINIGKEFLGEHNAQYGKDVADIINMAEADTSMTDFLYSIGRSSNTVISMLGAIIRDAQMSRDRKMEIIRSRVEKINHILVEAGIDSSYMYDEKGRIVSDYDWDTYFKEKAKYRHKLIGAGYLPNSIDFKLEMQDWENQNTVEVEVDRVSHRTERMPAFYLKEDFRKGWSDAQNEYYDKMIELKGEIGTLLPNYAQHQFIAPQVRTSGSQVIKEALRGERTFSNVAKWFLQQSMFWKMKEADTRFRSSGIYVGGEETLASVGEYDNTVLRQIPIFFVKKIDANNLSHDFSSAIQALASTALNYEAMDGVKDIAEMMTDYSARVAPVDKDSEGRVKTDMSRDKDNVVLTYLRKAAEANNVSTMLDSFVLKHIYGVENKTENTRWAVVCANLIGYTSLTGLAVNVKGALTNKVVGVLQTMIEASAGQYYNWKDLTRAEAILLGTQGGSTTGALLGGVVGGLPGAAIGLAAGTAVGAVGLTGKFVDIVTDTRNSKDTLIADFFDEAQEGFSAAARQRYHHTAFGRLLGQFNPMAMYSRGEYWIHMLNVYAILSHEKVIQYDPTTGERKKISLYEALEKGDKVDGSTELKLKDNIFRIDGVKIDGLSDSYFDAIKRRMRYVNQQCHGSMNKEDKGLLHQWMLGKFVMNFRQWMVEHYSRRFRTLHWDESIRDVDLSNFYNNTYVKVGNKKTRLVDALTIVEEGSDGSFHYEIANNVTTLDGTPLTNEVLDKMLNKYAEDSGWRMGYKVDAFKVFANFVKEGREYGTKASAYWNTLSETQKADVKRTLSEYFMILALAGLSGVMGDPDDHKGEFFYRLWQYVVKRCLFDEYATVAPGLIIEGKTLMQSPVAASKAVSGFLYPIYGISDITETVKSGRHKGENKYLKNIRKYTIPFYGQIDQLLNIAEDSSVYQTFDNQITR